jgi:hypothetical protein
MERRCLWAHVSGKLSGRVRGRDLLPRSSAAEGKEEFVALVEEALSACSAWRLVGHGVP